uniref:Uncharacterized protein n=1 Tax=Myoviridae sp. ctj9o3 TaxID=2826688 RepID=A0A8S5MC50_9CAUD|nr:MAG TPA: hypothetical protein [Myoviridae sp. ctj9o3]
MLFLILISNFIFKSTVFTLTIHNSLIHFVYLLTYFNT